jgi:hypothetical protein
MVGVAARQISGPITSDEDFKAAYRNLFANSQYQEATTRSTADEENVRARVQLAKDAFAKVT